MLIRLATPEDFLPIRDLLMQIQYLHAQMLPDIFTPLDPERITKKRYQDVIAHPHKQIYVAQAETAPRDSAQNHISLPTQVLGYVYAEVIESKGDLFHQPRQWVYIHQIAVHLKYRRQGYGEALIQRVLTFAQSRGVDRVEIEVWTFNHPAQSLYQKLGFAPQSERLWIKISPDP